MAGGRRPEIPAGVKRIVRQQCGFGCVICGCPVFHYDHIVDWSIVKEHSVGNLALLCEMHHGAKTTGKLSREAVQEAREKPFNVERGWSSGYQVEHSRTLAVRVADSEVQVQFDGDGLKCSVITLDNSSFLLLTSRSGYIIPSFKVTDHIGNRQLVCNEGEIRVGSWLWDYSYEGTRLQVRGKRGWLLLDLDFSDTNFHLYRGEFYNARKTGLTVRPDLVQSYIAGGLGPAFQDCQAELHITRGEQSVFSVSSARSLEPKSGSIFAVIGQAPPTLVRGGRVQRSDERWELTGINFQM